MRLDLLRETAIRWMDLDAKYVPLLREGGITAVVADPNENFERACLEGGIRIVAGQQIQFLDLHDGGGAMPGAIVVVKAGQWPGSRNADPLAASATRSLWIDQNCYLVGYLRALYPKRPALLGYLPDKNAGVPKGRVVRYDSLELALTEAWVAGGNYVMTLSSRFREALIRGTQDALVTWRRLGRTAKWLRDNVVLFRQRTLPVVTVLVDNNVTSVEIANLCYRQNVSPALVAAENPPAVDPKRRLVVVAVGIDAPKGEARRRILAHAHAGATVVVDDPGEKAWWRVAGLKLERTDPDRKLFSIAGGRVVAYNEPVTDPGEFALDIVDIVGQKRRACRLWNCRAGVALATLAPKTGPTTGSAALHVLNYGQPASTPVLARIQGNFTRATLLAPGVTPRRVKVARRGTSSEVAIPQLGLVATVVFG